MYDDDEVWRREVLQSEKDLIMQRKKGRLTFSFVLEAGFVSLEVVWL